ncbi:MAG: mechanosensitive ion channel family protein [Methylocella sp.]
MPFWPQFIAEHSQAAADAAALLLAGLSVLALSPRLGAVWRAIGQTGLFVALTTSLLAHGVEPYQPQPASSASAAHQLGIYFLVILWWCALGWSLVAFVRAFVIFERKPNESQLFQQLLAALIYLGVALAIASNVLHFAVGALLATSGAVAIILGLALQSTLADVFSGIAISLGRSYSIGDWIVVDSGFEGRIIAASLKPIGKPFTS